MASKRRICGASEVPPDGAAAFDVDGTRIMVANVQDTYFAIADTCTHAQGSLSEGYIDVDECTVECPLHGAVFSLRSGEVLEPPAEEDVEHFAVTVEGDDLYIEVGD